MRATQIELGGGRTIGRGYPALIVAEIGQNHNGRVELAEQLIDVAAWAGADAVKFVKRDLNSELASCARERPYQGVHSFGATYGEHRAALELDPDVHAHLRRRALGHGLLYLCTACDIPSARILEALRVDAFKVASRDLANVPLITYLAGRGLPLFLSTGMSALDEVDTAVAAVRAHTDRFVIMQCTSLYPTPPEHVHLRSLTTLADRYGALVGFSDHAVGTVLPAVAVALGAVVLEKHITLDRTMKGTDHACSLEPDELRTLVGEVRRVEAALGSPDKPCVAGIERVRAKLGRSLVLRVALPAGARLEEHMLTLKCPGRGLSWQDRGRVVGRRLRRALAADELVSPDDVS